jgi:protein tyrosine/serine phosphatase
MNRHILFQRMQRLLFATLLSSLMVLPSAASTDMRQTARASADVTIKNFGKVNDHLYRGAQPEGDDYRQLVATGVKTIVDLRSDNEPGARAAAEKAGLRYINLPLAPKGYPEADAAQRFLAIVNDQANGPFYVHCAGGRHRTGVMLAVYRMEMDGWDIERSYKEMKDYDFYTRFGHGCYKDYVYDYSRNLQARGPKIPATNAKTVVADGQ